MISTPQRGHPVKRPKGKTAEISTEASVYVGAMVNTMCTPVEKQRSYQIPYSQFKGSA